MTKDQNKSTIHIMINWRNKSHMKVKESQHAYHDKLERDKLYKIICCMISTSYKELFDKYDLMEDSPEPFGMLDINEDAES